MELKDLQAQLQTTFEDLKKMGDVQSTEIKKFGDATQETKNTIEAINKSFDELKGRIDKMETKANRLPNAGENENAIQKLQKRKKYFSSLCVMVLAHFREKKKPLYKMLPVIFLYLTI
jgi:HK97 family phage major capsid protein